MYRLKLENIGKIKSADVKIGGLTVLTGYNDIGKSTIGKVLWCLIQNVNSNLYEANNNILDAIATIRANFSNYKNLAQDYHFLDNNFLVFIEEFKNILHPYKGYDVFLSKDWEEIQEYFNRWLPQLEEDTKHPSYNNRDYVDYRQFVDRSIHAVNRMLTTAKELKEHGYPVSLALDQFERLADRVFHGDIFTTEKNYLVSLAPVDSDKTFVTISQNESSHGLYQFDVKHEFVFKDATYSETPMILNFKDFFNFDNSYNEVTGRIYYILRDFPTHINLVKKIESIRFQNPNIDAEQQFGNIKSVLKHKIQEIIQGNWVLDPIYNKLSFKRNDVEYRPVNVASGIKAFGMLQLLAEANCIREDSVLILDEPESHLHPEWEIKYGELLVWLATIGVPIVVSTHSTYIMESIHKYAKKYDAQDLVNYYIGEAEKDGSGTVFEDVTDNVPELFRKNSEAMQKLLFM